MKEFYQPVMYLFDIKELEFNANRYHSKSEQFGNLQLYHKKIESAWRNLGLKNTIEKDIEAQNLKKKNSGKVFPWWCECVNQEICWRSKKIVVVVEELLEFEKEDQKPIKMSLL